MPLDPELLCPVIDKDMYAPEVTAHNPWGPYWSKALHDPFWQHEVTYGSSGPRKYVEAGTMAFSALYTVTVAKNKRTPSSSTMPLL